MNVELFWQSQVTIDQTEVQCLYPWPLLQYWML